MTDRIKLTDGGGGEAMNRLLKEFVFKYLTHEKVEGGIGLSAMDDGAVIPIGDKNIVFTTDSYVVQPIFFKGGDIGKLAINGTINDLSVMGARPVALSMALVISEGFEKETIGKIIKSAAEAARIVGTPIVTGDTKVIGSKEAGIIINTSGIGIADKIITDCGSKPGDAILISGGIAEHGIAIISQREGIEFETPIVSDCREVYSIINDITSSGIEIHAAKDPTRGGIASALNEMASKSGYSFFIMEKDVPVATAVKSACEMLGLDPFEIASEGKVVLTVSSDDSKKTLEILKKHNPESAIIGNVLQEQKGEVILETVIGSHRIIRMPTGDPVPRVC